MTNSPYILIMAGGVGSRFWPASREHLPKQFLDITGSGKSLIRQTVDRFLNFIPLGLLFGQRPAVWWGKKNDIDLLLGVYKYGYANYVSIRNAMEYCFKELDNSQTYQDFPVADNLTRRLKKLINTIVKIQQNQG